MEVNSKLALTFSDTEDDDDEPPVTGMPHNRGLDESYLDESDDETNSKIQHNIEAGLIDSTQSLHSQLNQTSTSPSQELGPNGDSVKVSEMGFKVI